MKGNGGGKLRCFFIHGGAKRQPRDTYMDVSLNGRTPKSSILIGFSI